MKADFSYMTGSDGFTSILPDTPEAEREYNRIVLPKPESYD
jgi:hypothetical protein